MLKRTFFLASPVTTKATLRAALTSGSVKVILSGGGLGESLIGATYGGCVINHTTLPRHQQCHVSAQARRVGDVRGAGLP